MAKWIWNKNSTLKDCYVEFVSAFKTDENNLFIKISADSNYALYLNNKFVESGQYACYPDNPVCDIIKLKCKPGINQLRIIVYYVGDNSFSTYYLDKPGLYFEIYDQQNNIVLESNEHIKSAISKTYQNNNCLIISPQLGYTFCYDATKEKESLNYSDSIVVSKNTNFAVRENKKLVLLDKIQEKVIYQDENKTIVDLEKETTGFLYFDLICKENDKITISFGEHLENNSIKKVIGNRNFYITYIACKNRNKQMFPLRRLGLRYLQIESNAKIKINRLTIIPTIYPFKEYKYVFDNKLHERIYDICLHTLRCCYHEHYEDCPWREQSFYAFDSRNQMLSGYYAFKNKEQVRSSLKLISQDNRKDRLLSICYPSSFNLTIPSFSLHYFNAILEYYNHSKDKSLLVEIYPRLERLIDAFIDNVKDGLLYNFDGDCYWNFYEWIDGLDYHNNKCDIILNCLFILALNSMDNISKIVNINDPKYLQLAKTIKNNVNKAFYSKSKKIYFLSKTSKKYCQLANALAILSKVANKTKAKRIADMIVADDDLLISSSLSMKCFVYDALLLTNNSYQDYIIKDIEKNYSLMLENGATTVWETIKGYQDFDGAGSLCHGWSAIPIYYFVKFKIAKKAK